MEIPRKAAAQAVADGDHRIHTDGVKADLVRCGCGMSSLGPTQVQIDKQLDAPG